jgi:hypothetical protein
MTIKYTDAQLFRATQRAQAKTCPETGNRHLVKDNQVTYTFSGNKANSTCINCGLVVQSLWIDEDDTVGAWAPWTTSPLVYQH